MLRSCWLWFVCFVSTALFLSSSIGVDAKNLQNPAIQIRLAFGGNDFYSLSTVMTVSWTTAKPLDYAPSVRFGPAPFALDFWVSGSSHTYGTSWFHDVQLPFLRYHTKYYYQIVCDPNSTESPVLSFTSAMAPGAEHPFRVTVLGDMAWLAPVSGISGPAETFAGIMSTIDTSSWVLHVGDVSYADDWYYHDNYPNYPSPVNMHITYEEVWNGYQNWTQPLTQIRPYMVLPGNHEASCAEFGFEAPTACPIQQQNFTAYRNRFRMPGTGASQNMWWSIDYGLVHFVAIDTETDFPNSPEGNWGYGPFGDQLAWLQQDLQAAVANRYRVPWIVVLGHRQFYSSATSGLCASCRAAFEPLFLQYHIDMYICGHKHWSERMFAIANGAVVAGQNGHYNNSLGPVYIINGAAGNDEGLSGFGGPLKEETAFFNNQWYTFSFLDVHNATAISWKFVNSSNLAIIDELFLTKPLVPRPDEDENDEDDDGN